MFPTLLALTLSLGQIGRLSFFNQEVNLYLFDLVLVLWLLKLVIKYKARPIQKSLVSFRALYIFVAWLVLTFIFSLYRFDSFANIVASLYLLRLIVYFAFFVYFLYAVAKKAISKEALSKATTLFIALTFLFSAGQYLLYPNLRNLKYLGWDPHQFRVFGTFFDTSAAAAIFGLVTFFLYLKSDVLKNKRAHYAALINYIVLSLLTYSRGLYLALLTTLGGGLLLAKRYSFVLIGLGIFLVSLFLLPRPFGEGVNLSRVASIESRIKSNQRALSLSVRNPIFGVGYNHIRYTEEVRPSQDGPMGHSGASYHSSFLIVLATSGVIGLVLFALVLIRLFKISEAMAYYVVFLSIFSLVDNILLYPVVMLTFFFLAGFEEGGSGSIFRT